MDSEVQVEQNTTGLKHLRFLKEIAMKFLAILSSLYDFAKESSNVLKRMIVSVENVVVPIVKPVYEELKDLPEHIIVFVDDQFDKYAPSFLKNLVAKFQSLTDKTIPLVDKSQSLLQNTLDTTKSLVNDNIFQKGPNLANQALDTTKSILHGIPLVGHVESLITNPANLANQALNTTKSVVGGIPLMGNVAQSLITNPTDLANQLVNTTNSLINKNPILGAVNSTAQNFVKGARAVGLKATLQSAYLSFKLMGVPVIAEFWYKLDKYPLFHELSGVILPIVENLSEGYNKMVKYMNEKGYSLFGYLPYIPIDEMKAAYKLVKTTNDGLSAVGDLLGFNHHNN